MAYTAYAEDIGVNIHYEIYNIEPEQLAQKIKFAREHLDGFTVTMPYKKTVMQFADEMDSSAVSCGSINTMVVRNNRLTGYNTDGWGFIKHLGLEKIDLKDRVVVMVGAGGVASSIAYWMRESGVKEVRVLNIIREEGEALCASMGGKFRFAMLDNSNLLKWCGGADFFINASVLGQIGYPDYDSFDFIDCLTKDAVVYDVNYSKGDSNLLVHAAGKNHRALNGSSMSICQGIRAMEIWTGLTPRDETARQIILSRNYNKTS
jgi:shikimate dehydrogenase